jgi:diacylglycerol kinase family enzyme
MRAAMIVNPASDGGRTARAWPEIARRARDHGLEVDARLTEAPGHAAELVRAALGEGADLILTVGGDGTVSEAVNGFFADGQSVATSAELAVVMRGSGCDFARTFRIPKRTDAALAVAAKGESRTGAGRRRASSATSRAPA